jgi:hypothetical protein
MNFKGEAKRLTDYDIPRIGNIIGVGEDEIHAVLDVESRGSGFDKQGRPTALYEPHIAYKYSSGETRARLVKEGLAYPRWGQGKYPADSYDRIMRAYEIDPEVALLSTSWGLGQVMGFNYAAAGYVSPLAMVQSFMKSEAKQLEGMINFIVFNKLDDEIRRHDWAGFAKGYNGSGYKANKYDTRLAAAFKRWQGIKDTPWSPTMAVIETLENDVLAPHVVALEPTPSVEAPVVVAPTTPVQPAPQQTVVPPRPAPVAEPMSFFGWLASLFSKR